MFASVSCVLKEELGPHLKAIVERMIESLTSEEGVKVCAFSDNRTFSLVVFMECVECIVSILIGQVHYNSFDVSFLDFDNGEEGNKDGEEEGGGMDSVEDDEGIEG